jgi:hypothetical protein
VLYVAKEHRFRDIEDGVSLAVLSQREDRLGRLHHLPDLKTAGGNHTRGTGVQFGIAKRFVGRPQLRLRRFKRTFRGSQFLLRLVVGDAGGEAGRDERGLPIKRGFGHAQLGLRRADPCDRGIKLGLLLGRIEPRQNVAGIASTRPLTRNDRSAQKRAWIWPVSVRNACPSRCCTISVRTNAARSTTGVERSLQALNDVASSAAASAVPRSFVIGRPSVWPAPWQG